MRRSVTIILFAAAFAGAAVLAAQPEFRGRGALDPGVVVISVADAGLTYRVSLDAPPRIISWDHIRTVRGERAKEAAPFAELADALFRIRTRLERGDDASATDLAEPLYRKRAGLSGPSGSVLAECLLHLRLNRGAAVAAVWPWLDWVRVHAERDQHPEAAWEGGVVGRISLIDAERRLAPRVAPIFSRLVTPTALAALDTAGDWSRFAAADAKTADLALLYRHAAAFEVAPEAGDRPMPKITGGEPAVDLCAEIVQARIAPASDRTLARERLQKRLSTETFIDSLDLAGEPGGNNAVQVSPAWMEAWIRAGIGRSLLRESEPDTRRAGALALLHVPARFADVTPELARLCLAEAIATLRDLGDNDAVKVLEQDLGRSSGEFGGWPVEEPGPATEPPDPAAPANPTPAPSPATAPPPPAAPGPSSTRP